MKIVSLFKNFLIKKKLSKMSFGVTTDDNTRYTTVHVGPFPANGTFYKQSQDLAYFEIINISKENGTVTMCEIATDNEIEIPLKAFELLFQKLPRIKVKLESKKG